MFFVRLFLGPDCSWVIYTEHLFLLSVQFQSLRLAMKSSTDDSSKNQVDRLC